MAGRFSSALQLGNRLKIFPLSRRHQACFRSGRFGGRPLQITLNHSLDRLAHTAAGCERQVFLQIREEGDGVAAAGSVVRPQPAPENGAAGVRTLSC